MCVFYLDTTASVDLTADRVLFVGTGGCCKSLRAAPHKRNGRVSKTSFPASLMRGQIKIENVHPTGSLGSLFT